MIKITPIMPRRIHAAAMQQEFVRMMRDIGEEIRENFEDTTRTWRHDANFQPKFVIPKVGIDSISVETTTEDKPYLWLNNGTKRHWIAPKEPKKATVFPSEFIPKTFPGIIGSSTGFSGGDLVFSGGNWNEIEARHLDKAISEQVQKNIKNHSGKIASLVAKASGHRLT